MRVCLVSHGFPPNGGGEGTYTRSLVSGLAKLGHTVFLMVPRETVIHTGDDTLDATVIPIQTANFPSLRVASFLRGVMNELPTLARKEQIDVVHFTFDYPSLPIRLGKIGCPTVATVHHLHVVEALSVLHHHWNPLWLAPGAGREFLLSAMERRLISQVEEVIAVSRFTLESIVDRFGLPESSIRVIHDGIDSTYFKENDGGELFRRRFGDSHRFVLYVGRLDISKGVEYLIEAFAEVKRNDENALLVIVGSGSNSYLNSLRKHARTTGVGRHIIFAGAVGSDLLRSAYAAASVFVLPSLMEGLGITLLEAMASSTPCVATRVGGIPEVVRDGETGLLVQPGNSDALSDAILQIVLRPEWAKHLGANGRDLVERSFSAEKMAEITASVYEEVVKRHKHESK